MAAQRHKSDDELKELLGAIRTAVVFSGPGAQGRPPGGPSLEDDLDRVLAEVLGWKGRPDDTAGFVAALKQAFEVKQDGGVTTVKLRPRTVTPASLSAVTGFRATVLAQAKGTTEQALALLDGLRPLLADADPQDVEAVRSTIRSRIIQIQEELASTNPRVDRLDVLFDSLVGPSDADPAERGLLGRLEEVLGMNLAQAKTLEEELTLTNFLVLDSLLQTLAGLYRVRRDSFLDEGDNFLGSQLGLLSEELALIVESVGELVEALESVAFGPAERRAANLDLDHSSLTLDELVTWIDEFASDEGPALLRDGGRDMIGPVFVPTIERLRDLTVVAARPDGVEGLTEAHRAGLVDLSFDTLREHLDEALEIAQRIAQPGQAATVVERAAAATAEQADPEPEGRRGKSRTGRPGQRPGHGG
jgi:hypothetical protein